MKFAKVFQQVLEDEHIPEEWVSSAIQYKALKKCINKVVEELEEFGLEKQTLQALLDYKQKAAIDSQNPDQPIVSYEFENEAKGPVVPKLSVTIDTLSELPVDAKLSPDTLERIKNIAEIESSRISVIHKNVTVNDPAALPSPSPSPRFEELDNSSSAGGAAASTHKVIEIKLRSDSEFFDMLTSELMQLDTLKKAQEEQLLNLINELTSVVGKVVDPNRHPQGSNRFSRKGGSDMYVWREIFREYIEANIFFSTAEYESGEHDADMARQRLLFFAQRIMGDPDDPITFRQFQQQLKEQRQQDELRVMSHNSTESHPPPQQLHQELPHLETLADESYQHEAGTYSRALGLLSRVRHRKESHGTANATKPAFSASTQLTRATTTTASDGSRKITPAPNSVLRKFRHPDSRPAFKSFWLLNNALLQALQFQTLNKTAITKILKKFDKQTALTSSVSFPLVMAQSQHPFMATSLAKSICYVMAERLLPVTPQIEDFLCPICTSIAYKPIRLDCSHVFCVRCLVHLQRSNEDRCPICRAAVVLNADERNLDEARLEYLKLYFPKETREKQAETERQIAEEQLEKLKTSGECVIQ